MKPIIASIIFCIFIFSCSKQKSSPACDGNPGPGNPPPVSKDTSYITANVAGQPIKVTSIIYNRNSGNFNFTVQNEMQKIDVRCFHFYEPNRWNYQYSDSITYSTRKEVLSTWSTMRAINWGDVTFDCCGGPLEDSVISGTYSGTFPSGETNIVINGVFHLIF